MGTELYQKKGHHAYKWHLLEEHKLRNTLQQNMDASYDKINSRNVTSSLWPQVEHLPEWPQPNKDF